MKNEVLILGAGPAGLSCAHGLCERSVCPIVWERHEQVGGLCRTIPYKGFKFDVGPHRFFTRNDEVDGLWHSAGGADILSVKRLTRILYRNHLFRYPLQPLDALRGLGIGTSVGALFSYIRQRATSSKIPPAHFEDWVIREFGKVLYEIFFKTYTEKVWGIPCAQIAAEWASQRIKGLDLGKALLYAVMPFLNRKQRVKSLIDEFDYPRLGAGQVYEKMAQGVVQGGGSIVLGATAHMITHDGNRVTYVEGLDSKGRFGCHVEHLFSSIPLTEFVMKLRPMAPERVLDAVRALYYRDHITVNLIVRRASVFPDNWVYVHSPEVRMARIASYGNFSTEMLTSPSKSALSVEYFTFAHEDLWRMGDSELVELATEELCRVGLVREDEVEDGFVLREKDAYPTYFTKYRQHLDIVKDYLAVFKNVMVMGRGGMYRYNNQDHSILSGLLAARNYCGEQHDLWEINEEKEYLEEKKVPLPISPVSRV